MNGYEINHGLKAYMSTKSMQRTAAPLVMRKRGGDAGERQLLLSTGPRRLGGRGCAAPCGQ
jgi:hypothetical protein